MGGEKGRTREIERREGRDKSCLSEEIEKKELWLEAEDQPVSADGGGNGRGLSLKETEQSLYLGDKTRDVPVREFLNGANASGKLNLNCK